MDRFAANPALRVLELDPTSLSPLQLVGVPKEARRRCCVLKNLSAAMDDSVLWQLANSAPKDDERHLLANEAHVEPKKEVGDLAIDEGKKKDEMGYQVYGKSEEAKGKMQITKEPKEDAMFPRIDYGPVNHKTPLQSNPHTEYERCYGRTLTRTYRERNLHKRAVAVFYRPVGEVKVGAFRSVSRKISGIFR